jgi:transposase-like protein
MESKISRKKGVSSMTERRQDIMCPYCKEMTGRKVGMYATVKDGKKQRFQCKECGRSWY